jgi:hypothetical protein
LRSSLSNIYKLSNLKKTIPITEHYAEFEKLKNDIILSNEKTKKDFEEEKTQKRFNHFAEPTNVEI